MSLNDILGNPKLHKAAATFAVGYAKRMMEGQYSRIMQTKLGKRLHGLDGPNKYAVEAALNGLVAYLSTKESAFATSPVREFLWELAKDAPSEISRRILNGERTRANDGYPVIDVEVVESEQRSVIEGLLKMKGEDLGAFLTWLESATAEERRCMAEAVSQLTEEEQPKLAGLSAAQREILFESIVSSEDPSPESTPTPAEPDGGKAALATVAEALRSVA